VFLVCLAKLLITALIVQSVTSMIPFHEVTAKKHISQDVDLAFTLCCTMILEFLFLIKHFK
jgi:hypothetical protein